mmetsp:Transcript_8706/g.18705  ORF Transcript_8706/g.18705 Transcript_8706/m.18705 type:complete len:427 (+) Transcript_8706:130-1410(+)
MERLVVFALLFHAGEAFSPSRRVRSSPSSALNGAPKRLSDNVDGPLYVNEKCINCAACAHFAPDVFGRAPADGHHLVHHQPSSSDAQQLDRARAALQACPVAAIRVENTAKLNHASKVAGGDGASLSAEDEKVAKSLALNPKINGLDMPFPRPVLPDVDTGVYFLGSHNEASFGATPYLVRGRDESGNVVSVMVDTPKFTPAALRAVQSLTGDGGPDYLFLTHVDDTAHHMKWSEEFPETLRRIFHSGDLGVNNWIGDATLEDVEVLLEGTSDVKNAKWMAWTLDGSVVDNISFEGGWPEQVKGDFIILHTPGHSNGSISLLYRNDSSGIGVIFTGDSYAYTTRRGGRMTGFSQYAKDGMGTQTKMLRMVSDMSGLYDLVAPGHGHIRSYVGMEKEGVEVETMKREDINEAVQELAGGRSVYQVSN